MGSVKRDGLRRRSFGLVACVLPTAESFGAGHCTGPRRALECGA